MFATSLLLFVSFVEFITSTPLPKDAIHLKDIQVLTLERGKMTTGRRSSPVKQLDCIGGPASKHYNDVKVIQCINKGFDGSSVNWKCEAHDIPKTIKLGTVSTVTCEGYDYSDDPRVLIGSCGLEYELEYTGWKEEEKVVTTNEVHHHHHHHQVNTKPVHLVVNKTIEQAKNKTTMVDILFIILLVLAVYLIYKSCVPNTDSKRPKKTDYGSKIHIESDFKETETPKHIVTQPSPPPQTQVRHRTVINTPTTIPVSTEYVVLPQQQVFQPVPITTNNYYTTTTTTNVNRNSISDYTPKSSRVNSSRSHTTSKPTHDTTTYATTKLREDDSSSWSSPSTYTPTEPREDSSSSWFSSSTYATTKPREDDSWFNSSSSSLSSSTHSSSTVAKTKGR